MSETASGLHWRGNCSFHHVMLYMWVNYKKLSYLGLILQVVLVKILWIYQLCGRVLQIALIFVWCSSNYS
jgi:hypothetical protein